MNDQGSLVDRMHRAMAESARPWSAAEIAESFLGMRAGGPRPDPLVRGILLADPRFSEATPGNWSAVVRSCDPLASGRYLLAWIETGEARHPEQWRVHLRAAEEPGSGGGRRREDRPGPWTATDPRAWREAMEMGADRRLATFQPGTLGRFLQWMSRRWAFAEPPDPLDLLGVARFALVEEGLPVADAMRLSDPAHWIARWGLGPVAEEPSGVPLPALGLLLDLLLERYGSHEEEDLMACVDAALGARPVSFDRFGFTRAELEEIPETSGIYRFYGSADEVLYIGKAVRLRRRIASYFRPLRPGPGRREELLDRIRRFEAVPLPSELEALILESRGIRTQRPPWNVQVDVHEPESLPPEWWWPLFFLAPGDDPIRATALLLRGSESGWLFHLPRTEQPGFGFELATWLRAEAKATGPPDPQVRETRGPRSGEGGDGVRPFSLGGAIRLDPPEARLALRFFLRERDRLDRVDEVRCRDADEIAATLLRLARDPGFPSAVAPGSPEA